MDIQLTRKQKAFYEADAEEVLFGGAAGGGKSYGQLVDALLFALKYKGSKQLILRRTYPELEKSIIRTSLELYPREVADYNGGNHVWKFLNGSIVEFGACDAEKDVYKYQSAEYDVLRFDELTHFTDTMYTYLISRVRGTNGYPKQVKSSTNPGGVGHTWVKERFIDPAPPGKVFTVRDGDGGEHTRIFIPSLVDDNVFLMRSDPSYKKRLKNLSEQDQKALLYGDWDLDEGAYFDEWRQDIHVIKPRQLPDVDRRYMSIDYGLDMLACLWYSVDTLGYVIVYRELYQSNLIIDDAARAIMRAMPPGEIRRMSAIFAPRDLWNRRQETGRSVADRFAEMGLYLDKVSNGREAGWYEVKRYLRPQTDEFGDIRPKMQVFNTCRNLIRCLPALRHDEKHPNDVATEPHELTHAPDALRYFCDGMPLPAEVPVDKTSEDYVATWEDELDDFNDFTGM